MADASPKDGITLLKDGHREAEKLFKEFEGAKSGGRKQEIAKQICLALSVHFALEEKIFYPACKGTVDESELKEGYVEHDAAKLLVAEIEANEGGGDSFFDTKVHVLSEEIEHHIKEEEKPGGIFSEARKGDLDMAELGQRMAKLKEDLTKKYKAEGVPEPELRTMDEVEV